MRKADVRKRKRNIDSLKENRANKIKDAEDRATARQEEYDKEKLQAEEEEKEFNEEEFEARFLLKNPEVIIPDDVEYDVDADFVLEDNEQ